MIPTGFYSFQEYRQFICALEFQNCLDHTRVVYDKIMMERLGDIFIYPTMKLATAITRNVRNPLTILSITITCIIAVTILFYPDKLIRQIGKILPFAQKVNPKLIKACLYGTVQFNILGIFLRAMGRLDVQSDLWQQWNQYPRQIIPIGIGTHILPVS